MVEPMTKERAYAVLGVDESADFSELSLAFRNLREKYHPDKNPGDKEAEEKFKESSLYTFKHPNVLYYGSVIRRNAAEGICRNR